MNSRNVRLLAAVGPEPSDPAAVLSRAAAGVMHFPSRWDRRSPRRGQFQATCGQEAARSRSNPAGGAITLQVQKLQGGRKAASRGCRQLRVSEIQRAVAFRGARV